jgi:hypothetical protein
VLSFERGRAVIEEGATCVGMFIVLEGQAVARQHGEELLRCGARARRLAVCLPRLSVSSLRVLSLRSTAAPAIPRRIH